MGSLLAARTKQERCHGRGPLLANPSPSVLSQKFRGSPTEEGSPLHQASGTEPVEGRVPRTRCRLPGELWGVVAVFNPAGYPNKLRNLTRFVRQVRSQGIPILIVELAFADAEHEVPEALAERVVRLRTSSVLWQKERLLNIAVELLPPECDKVAWLDGDILFDNPDWVQETARLLESYAVVQPFESACWLREGELTAPCDSHPPRGNDAGQCLPGMAYTMAHTKDPQTALSDYYKHGHVGFAWATRREILQRHGLYDALILGNGDFAMAHAMYGNVDYWTGRHWQCAYMSEAMVLHIERWSRAFYEDVQGSVAYVPGRVLHLWHGNQADRQYTRRLEVLRAANFDPDLDLVLEQSGCWTWATDRPELRAWAAEYFRARREG